MHHSVDQGPQTDPPRWRAAGQCAVCRGWGARALCPACVAQFAAAAPRCERCGERTGSATSACGACLADPPPFDACRVACDYAFPWDRLIADFKFNSQVELAGPLARLMLRSLHASAGERPHCVLPVPLAAGRLAERGYNQAWELARRVAAGLRCPAIADVLQRPLEGEHQAQLTLAQRRTRPRGAFMVTPTRRDGVQGKRVAVVDDVMTSGATLRDAAAALRRAGAVHVEAWVLARTPAPTAAG